MHNNTNRKLNIASKSDTNYPSIPNGQKSKGGFEKFAKIRGMLVTYRNNKWNVVDTLVCLILTGRVGGFSLKSAPDVFFLAQGVAIG